MMAPMESPKKLMAYPADLSLAGAAIRLASHNGSLGLTEGIETALAVMLLTGQPNPGHHQRGRAGALRASRRCRGSDRLG